jgi:hypothetical protein
MATELVGFGLPIVLSSTTTIGLTAVVTNGSSDVTLDTEGGAAAYGTISAGTYTLPELIAKVAPAVQTWLYNAMVADAAITTKPSSAAAITVACNLTPAATMGGSLVSLVIGSALGGAQISGVAATIKSITLLNSAGFWTKLGLAYEVDTTSTTNHSANVVTISLFQSRYFYSFERSTEDSFDTPVAPSDRALVLKDGKISFYTSGRTFWTREFSLVDLNSDRTGPAIHVATFGAFGGTRDILTVPTPTLTLTNLSVLYRQSDLITTSAHACINGWVGRIRDTSSSQVRLVDLVPSSNSPASGAPITQVSEAMAMWLDARRLGKLFLFESTNSSSTIRWTAGAYALAGNGEMRFSPERRDIGVDLYTARFSLIRAEDPQRTLIS